MDGYETESMLLTALLFLHIHNILFINFFLSSATPLAFSFIKERKNNPFFCEHFSFEQSRALCPSNRFLPGPEQH